MSGGGEGDFHSLKKRYVVVVVVFHNSERERNRNRNDDDDLKKSTLHIINITQK